MKNKLISLCVCALLAISAARCVVGVTPPSTWNFRMQAIESESLYPFGVENTYVSDATLDAIYVSDSSGAYGSFYGPCYDTVDGEGYVYCGDARVNAFWHFYYYGAVFAPCEDGVDEGAAIVDPGETLYLYCDVVVSGYGYAGGVHTSSLPSDYWAHLDADTQQATCCGSNNLQAAYITQDNGVNSPSGQYTLYYQADGNLVLYDNYSGPLWATGTSSTPGSMFMQGDGNLVVYDNNGNPLWDTDTAGNSGAYLAVLDSGRFGVFASDDTVLWWSAN